jgi:hypothetical protein
LAASREPSGPPARAAHPRTEDLLADRQEEGQAGPAEPQRHASARSWPADGGTSLSGSGGSRAPSSAWSWCDRPRPRRAGVTGPPGGVADESGVAVPQLGPLLLRPNEACQATGLGRAGARCGESTRGVAALHAQGSPPAAGHGPWRVGWSGPGRAAGVALAVGIGRGRRPDRAWAHAQRGGGWGRGRGGRGPRRGRPWLGDGGPSPGGGGGPRGRGKPRSRPVTDSVSPSWQSGRCGRAGPRAILAGAGASDRLWGECGHPARLSRVGRHVQTPDNAAGGCGRTRLRQRGSAR